MKVEGSEHEIVEIVEFTIGQGGSRTASKITTLDLLRNNFSLFRDLLGRIPWEKAPQGRGVQELGLIFKDRFLQAQEQWILWMSKNLGTGGKRPAWMNKELLS